MATDTYWQLDKEYHTIAEQHDLIVRVIEHENIIKIQGTGDDAKKVSESVPKKVHEFKVIREVLVKSCEYFGKVLSNDRYREGRQTVVDILEDSGQSMQIWFTILHDGDDMSTYRSTSQLGVWEMLAAAHKYGFDPKSEAAKKWFNGWYEAKRQYGRPCDFVFTDAQGLLFPAYTFDNAKAFLSVSKFLVYHATGHIQERRPDGFKMDHLRLDGNVIQQLNAAKGRLKTILHRGLYGPIGSLLNSADCVCSKDVLWAYEKSLTDSSAWPLETAYLRMSMADILDQYETFSVTSPPTETCSNLSCSFDFVSVVHVATQETRSYFDGLCLDCMDRSKPKFQDDDQDYWNHAKPHVKWDHKCRVTHDQPTWYFSFMGRRQKMITWSKRSGHRS